MRVNVRLSVEKFCRWVDRLGDGDTIAQAKSCVFLPALGQALLNTT
jgi:hypothetical protein